MTPEQLERATDEDLLHAHVDGDPVAFGALFHRHRDRLWAVALRTMGNREDAADGLQDGLVAAYRRAGTFRGDSAVTTWLHRVVVNACLDRLRSAKVRRAEPLPDDLEEYGGRGSTVSASTEDPADLSVRDERRRLVLAALGQLPDEQRAALVLVDMEGYPVADAAAILDCAVGTVKSRCSRRCSTPTTVPRATRCPGTPTLPGPSNPTKPPGARRPPPDPRDPPTRRGGDPHVRGGPDPPAAGRREAH